MSRLGFKSVVYFGETCLGEIDTIPVKDQNFQFPNNEIRIQHISPSSERCHPSSVLQTVSSSVRCKLEPSSASTDHTPLINLHASCFYELKTAVVVLGSEEVHLVAMRSKQKRFPCFWCYSVPCGLYAACLGMLNMRCLAIVFDLDETLIVANTMKSFEDRIETLQVWIERENDPIRVSGMSAEMKRYVEDRALLKQFAETDSVVDGAKVYKVQQEEVPRLSDGHDKVVRPVIRVPEKNIVLTRINPEIRDTSVLVRLRPAWEDLRTYLTAKGRKRFEVYVCTMAERDYALEMWRLLDPESHLINSKQLLSRVVCVKSGSRKSLLNVFQDGDCHPNMAMVIDDRLKVWEDKDQPRVHVVPPFTPYYAPQAETANAVPVLCVARNVACDVRARFFKEFDDALLRKISELFYEDEVVNLPPAPDVSNYLLTEDTSCVPNGMLNAPLPEGMSGPEVAQRLSQSDEKSAAISVAHPMNNHELKLESPQLHVGSAPSISGPSSLRAVLPSEKPSLLGAPFRRDSSFSELDPDTKRRLLVMNHGQDMRYRGSAEPPILSRLPRPVLPLQPQGGRMVEEDTSKGHFDVRSVVHESDASRADKQLDHQKSPIHTTSTSVPMEMSAYVPTTKNEQENSENDVQKQVNQFTEIGVPHNHSASNREQVEGGKVNIFPSLSIGVLQEIGRRCSSKVEFRPVVSTSEELQFSVEVFFTGEKIGVGMGRTRKDAQQQAAENALRSLADRYVSYIAAHSRAVDKDFDKLSIENENGFLWDIVNPGSEEQPLKDGLSRINVSEVADVAARNSSSNAMNLPMQKRAGSPRLPESCSNKRLKGEISHDSSGRPSSSEHS